jgi:hypothetical protein
MTQEYNIVYENEKLLDYRECWKYPKEQQKTIPKDYASSRIVFFLLQ